MIMFLIMFIIKTVALLFPISFKCPVRPDWKCRRCVVMIVMIIGILLVMLRMRSDDHHQDDDDAEDA